MRIIVFSTIKENLKSFFQREEDLAAKPKAIPDTASEVFDKPATSKIIEKPLPNSQIPQIISPASSQLAKTTPPKLAITPDDLRSALQKNMQQSPQPQQPANDINYAANYPQYPQQPVTTQISAPKKMPEPIHLEIAEFEKAINAHEKTIAPRREEKTQYYSKPASHNDYRSNRQLSEGFFDEYKQFLLEEDLGEQSTGSQDIISKMKSFHQHRKEGKEFYIMSRDLESAAKRKLDELQNLEQEWFNAQQQMDELVKSNALLEHEIEVRTSELRNLIQQAKQKSKLERKTAPGQEFVLKDGRKLSSLLDLKLSLHTMSDLEFNDHVNYERNDFAAWVRSCLNDENLAKQVAMTHTREQLLMLLGKL